jgi:hypothetical protein
MGFKSITVTNTIQLIHDENPLKSEALPQETYSMEKN